MNRKQKIIVSVTSIFLVLLLLVGLTYAYFLTQINGNENSKSISVTTANLALVYGDGNGVITTDEPIIPGTTLDSKTFTVKNEGNAETDYVVVIEDVKVTYATTVGENEAGTTTTFESNDFVYTLTCESDGESCSGVDTETIFPINGGILVGNKIEVGKTHTYTLTVTYKETGVDQSNDMNKTLEAKVNIRDIAEINPYSTNKNTLAYNIINNAVLGKTGTTLLASPKAPVATSISDYGTGKYNYETIETSSLCADFYPWHIGDTEITAQSGNGVESFEEAIGKYVYDECDGWTKYLESYDATSATLLFKSEEMLTEKTLTVTQDDLGTSYYYRGAVEDNYVEFNDMCWRIVRIEGDGSIKITLAAQKKCSEIKSSDTKTAFIGEGHYGWTYDYITNSDGLKSNYKVGILDYLNGQTNIDASMKNKFEDWLMDDSGIDTSKLKKDDWCLGNVTTVYDETTGILLNNSVNDLLYERSSFIYDTYRRLYGVGTTVYATLRCDGKDDKTFESYIGTLTADEIVFAGGKMYVPNNKFYLLENSISEFAWLTLSLMLYEGSSNYTYEVLVGELAEGNVALGVYAASSSFDLRPAITLASNTIITSGDGTKTNPYIIG